MDCIFCNIAVKKSPADIVYEDDAVIAFKDIAPSAPVHVLIMPKRHITSIIVIDKKDKTLLTDIIWRGKLIAKEKGLDKTGYKLIFNCGRGGGQIIDHIHLHLMGGWKG